ncbi:MAG TPA: GyrI-like domain-containing protein [Terriglobales bacterium]|nr:GyrI-like domain-containing protein [Terriglobales bacterium]
MRDFVVEVKRLEPMRVASVRVVGENPERDAWQRLRAWAESRGIQENLARQPVFGFSNPNPVPFKKEYGYEVWCCVGPEVDGRGEVEVKEVPGGLFAATTCKLRGDPSGLDISEAWLKLWEWVQASPYKWRTAQELERPLDPHASVEDMVLELWLPVEEKT